MSQAGERLVNIGERQRRARLLIGIVFIAVAVAMAVAFAAGGVSGGLRWLVLIPLYTGIHTVIEAATGRCPGLAEKQQRNLHALLSLGGQWIGDDQEARAIRTRARREAGLAVALSVVLTLIYVVVTT